MVLKHLICTVSSLCIFSVASSTELEHITSLPDIWDAVAYQEEGEKGAPLLPQPQRVPFRDFLLPATSRNSTFGSSICPHIWQVEGGALHQWKANRR